MPVVDAPFVVKDGKLIPDDPTALVNGDFSQVKDGKLVGWVVDMPGKIGNPDGEVKHEGKPSLRLEDPKTHDPQYAHCRAWQNVKVKPFRYYRLSCWVKTDKFSGLGDTRIMALGTTKEHEGRVLNVGELGIKATQDWAFYEKTFNTQDFNEVAIYVGSWDAKAGKIWFADVKMEPGGLVDLLRRDGAPFKATTADAKTVLEEGKDLPEVKDPGLGKSPYNGGFNWHKQPEIRIPEGSRLKEGDKALLSYCHTMPMYYNDQVPICMSEPKTYELIKWHIEGVARNLQPDFYFMEHDEIRMGGWDASCQKTGKTPGGILADNIRKCADIIRKADPGKGMFVWSDMFDPFHNACRQDYYLMCKGKDPWYGSWEGLPKEVGLINWNAGKADSVKFFAKDKGGHPQIISCPNGGTAVNCLKGALPDAAGSIVGVIYTTWSGDFGPNFEKHPAAVRAFEKEYNAAK